MVSWNKWESTYDAKSLFSALCDPSKDIKLPLMCSDSLVPPLRFRLDDDHRFYFSGRCKFNSLCSHLRNHLKRRDSKVMWLIGNIGVGKSHLLAAYVCYSRLLLKNDSSHWRVVYISDCKLLLKNIGMHVIEALRITFAGVQEILPSPSPAAKPESKVT